jgi:hypothetical protein
MVVVGRGAETDKKERMAKRRERMCVCMCVCVGGREREKERGGEAATGIEAKGRRGESKDEKVDAK